MAKFSIEEVSPIERRISVEVPPEDIRSQLDQAYQQVSLRARVPGFRPGKVPRRKLETLFKDQVEADVVQHLVEHSYREALEAHPELQPVSTPRVTNEKLDPSEPFRYQARVEIMPKVEPKEYEGLALKRSDATISDAQVDQEIERLRDSMAQVVAVEGRTTAQEGDHAQVSYTGTLDGKPFPGSSNPDATVEVAAGEFIDGKIPALAGANVGEAREVQYTFPTDYRLAEFQGKTATFQVTLKEVRKRDVPALDDALAKQVGAGETLEDLRQAIRREMSEQAKEKARREEREQLIGGLIERNPFEVPSAMIERMIDSMLENAMNRLARQGMDPRKMQLDFERMRETFRPQAVIEVKGALLLEAVAEKEKIVASDEDLDAKIRELSEQMHLPVDELRRYLASGAEAQGVRRQIKEEKTLAFLASKANSSES